MIYFSFFFFQSSAGLKIVFRFVDDQKIDNDKEDEVRNLSSIINIFICRYLLD